jgi:chromosome segregation ATPase
MQIDKKDIEEVGEAVEALGVMMERELQRINHQLNQLIHSISEAGSQEKNWEEEIPELRSQIQKTKELLEGFEVAFSRTEARISELQTLFQDEEDNTTEIRNDLLIIKRDLQFVRSDLKEILEDRKYLDKKLKDFENRIDGLEKERFV